MTNHPNRNWKRRWTVDFDSLTATHETGVCVIVTDDPANPLKFNIENLDALKGTAWERDPGRLVTEALRLFIEATP